MHQSRTLSIGMDVHQDTSAVAYGANDHDAAVVALGPIGTRQADLAHLIRPIPSKAQHLVVGYEAGPCGSWRSRDLTQQGHRGWGVAPSRMPHKAGDRGTTDRRDAVQLARLMRSGELPRVYGPMVDDEAIRDLARAREAAIGDLKTATCRLTAFWRRHDSRSTGRATWGPAQLRGLAAVGWATPAHQIVFQEDVRTVHAHTERLQRLEQARQAQVKAWRLPPVVEALEGRRGVQCPVAVTMVAARGDLTRFEKPRQVMKSLGLIPSA